MNLHSAYLFSEPSHSQRIFVRVGHKTTYLPMQLPGRFYLVIIGMFVTVLCSKSLKIGQIFPIFFLEEILIFKVVLYFLKGAP